MFICLYLIYNYKRGARRAAQQRRMQQVCEMSLGCSGGGGSDGRAHIIAGLGTCTAVRINRVFVWFIAKQTGKGKWTKEVNLSNLAP